MMKLKRFVFITLEPNVRRGAVINISLGVRVCQLREQRILKDIVPVVHAKSIAPCATPRNTHYLMTPVDTPLTQMDLLDTCTQQDITYYTHGVLLGRFACQSWTLTTLRQTSQTYQNNQMVFHFVHSDLSFDHERQRVVTLSPKVGIIKSKKCPVELAIIDNRSAEVDVV